MEPNEEKQMEEGKEGTSHPESVPWNQYVGLKEKFNKTETQLKEQVQSLEEKVKSSPKSEEHTRLQEDLTSTKAELAKLSDQLKGIQDLSLAEKRDNLKKKGVPEEEVANMTEEALTASIRMLDNYKPKPDLGVGGGTGSLTGTPMELARQAYSKSNR